MRTLLYNPAFRLLLVILVAAGVQLVAWVADALEKRWTPQAVKAARLFLTEMRNAAYKNDDVACANALSMLSAASRQALEIEAQMRDRRWDTKPRPCAQAMQKFLGLREETARLASQANRKAIVSIEHVESDPKSFLIPGFWATRTIRTQAEMRLIEEAGAWKIVIGDFEQP